MSGISSNANALLTYAQRWRQQYPGNSPQETSTEVANERLTRGIEGGFAWQRALQGGNTDSVTIKYGNYANTKDYVPDVVSTTPAERQQYYQRMGQDKPLERDNYQPRLRP